jgi:succinoglycan biosynthesis protein ExoA
VNDEPADLLIVIPTLNEERHLRDLLAQFLSECPQALIVVADGGSTDRSVEIVTELAASHPRLLLMHNPARIQSAGINRAVAAFGGNHTWLLRVDAHCDYPAGYAHGLLAAAAANGATSVVVPMVSRGESCFQVAAAAAQNSVLGTGGSAHRHVGTGRFIDHGHHALMQIALFREVGGYREDMSHNEDAELDLRLTKAGGRIWLEPAQAIGYYPRKSARGLWRQYFGYGRGRSRTLRLHGARPKLRQLLPLAVPVACVLALFAPIEPFLAVPLGCWSLLCLGAGAWTGWRAGGGCAFLAGIPAMIAHLAWAIGFLIGIAG